MIARRAAGYPEDKATKYYRGVVVDKGGRMYPIMYLFYMSWHISMISLLMYTRS